MKENIKKSCVIVKYCNEYRNIKEQEKLIIA